MNQDDYIEFHKAFCERAHILTVAKNEDYSRPSSRAHDPLAVFHNFLHSERLGLCTAEQGILVRMSDKIARLSNLVNPGHKLGVKTESLEDSCLDLINYSVLLAAIIKAKGGKQ